MSQKEKDIGRLERKELRDIWQDEARDFTPWLARNLDLLGETIGIKVELEGEEESVGPYRADIVCRDIDDRSLVLIENQIEKTDHTHLGQLMTYAAGLEAATIIWVAKKFTDEHRAALDWLNEITDEMFSFFGLEVELWKIDQSRHAPKFNIISKPNSWSRSVRTEYEMTDTQRFQRNYWEKFLAYARQRGLNLGNRSPVADGWMGFNFDCGSNFQLCADITVRDKRLATSLRIFTGSDKRFYRHLFKHKADIESEIEEKLEWREMPDKKSSRIILYKENTDARNEDDWKNQHEWFASNFDKFAEAFRTRIQTIDSDEGIDEESETEDEE